MHYAHSYNLLPVHPPCVQNHGIAHVFGRTLPQYSLSMKTFPSADAGQADRLDTHCKCGFSLVELLCVIAIIGVLSAIILPVLSSMRASANKAENILNLRSLVQGWHLYAADNGGYFPVGLTWGAEMGNITNPPNLVSLSYLYWWSWYSGVARYMPTLTAMDTAAYRMRGGPQAPSWESSYKGYFPPNYLSEYMTSCNSYVGYHFNRFVGFYTRMSLQDIQDPSRTPLLYAYFEPESTQHAGRYFSAPNDDFPQKFMDFATNTMDGGNHFAFCDGHVEWVDRMDNTDDYLENMRWKP